MMLGRFVWVAILGNPGRPDRMLSRFGSWDAAGRARVGRPVKGGRPKFGQPGIVGEPTFGNSVSCAPPKVGAEGKPKFGRPATGEPMFGKPVKAGRAGVGWPVKMPGKLGCLVRKSKRVGNWGRRPDGTAGRPLMMLGRSI
jgi:hypothetical protein